MSSLTTTALATLLLLMPASALAAEEQPEGTPEPRKEEAHTEGAHAEGANAEEGHEGEHGEEAEPDWEARADFVIGAATGEVLTEGRPTGAGPAPNIFDSTRVMTYSFLVGLERRLGERVKVGARIPLIDGYLKSRTGAAASRSVFLAGNLELGGEFIVLQGEGWEVNTTLELALPTGGGTEPPSAQEVAADPAKRFEYESIDRFAAARAASASRGVYESALYESGRLGIVPRLGARFHTGIVTISPMVKVENLFDVKGDAEKSYIGELVAGVRAGVRVLPWFEPNLHVWTTIVYTAHDAFEALVIDPGLRFPFGHVIPQVDVIVPVAGNLVDDKVWGARAAVAAEF